MKYTLLVLGVLISLTSICQDTDTYQPDSVYRINKVKTRTVVDLAGNPWQTVLTYDTLGRVVLWRLLKDGTPVQKLEYRYDNVGKQIAEIYSSREATLTYDALGRITGKSLKDPNGKQKMEVIIGYDPLYESIKYFKPNGEVESLSETYYEKQYLSKKSKGYQGDETWDYNFKNTFSSKTGRLVKRECFSGKKIKQTILYQYNEKGLLVQKTTMSDIHPPIIENFEYSFR